jgi:hypothetical protein
MYGENSGILRTELSRLLRQHRIQQRIGGPGMHTVPVTTTATERAEIGRLIQRYRFGVLVWCRQALTSAGPGIRGGGAGGSASAEVRRRLLRTINASTATLPTMADLTTPHEFPLVEAWRLAARAACLGEHDFAGDMGEGRLDRHQRLTVTKDAAEILRGLLVLDRRYRNIPGWEPLSGAGRLQRAAEACAFIEASDYTVDRRGWRPPPRTIDGPARAGLAGVIQAEHNVLIHLNGFPNALNFRRLLDSQRELSNLLAGRVATEEPESSARWAQRASTYAALHREARDLGGQVGDGSAALAEAAHAILRLRSLPRDSQISQRALRDLTVLCHRVDERVADLFAQGAHERLYFVRTKLPRIDDLDGQITHRVRERFTPIISPIQTDLVHLVRERLRPEPAPACPPADARATRLELSEAITHRPQSRASGLGP